MKKTDKILTILLASLMLLSVFTGCSQNKDEVGGDKEATSAVSTERATETVFMADQLPEDLNYEGAVCNIFCWNSWDVGEFFVE